MMDLRTLLRRHRATITALVLIAVGAAINELGILDEQSTGGEQVMSSHPSKPHAANGGAMVLALSWQPAFCEQAGRRVECRSQTSKRYDANHFSLHGLWPKGQYCGVDGRDISTDRNRRWRDLPRLELSSATRQELERVMPGEQSYLHRHEWFKHGTCYSDDAEQYFSDSLEISAAFNGSAVRALFSDNIGRELSARDIKAAFEESFGRGAGDSVRISCRDDGGRRLISELQIGLKGTIGRDSIGQLLKAAPRSDAGCPRGIVDPVGNQ